MNVKQMLYVILQKMKRQIISETKTVTTGTELYNEHYFADVNIPTPSGYEFLSVDVITAQNNRLAFVENLSWTYRVFTKIQSTQVTIKVNFIKTT